MTTRKEFWTDSDIGLLILRITLGVTVFLHGWSKVQHGIEEQMQLLENIGLPGFFMYFGYISQVLAPALIILGIFTRLSALAIIMTLVVVLFAIPFPVMALGEHGEWVIEIQLFFLVVPVALLFTGPGRFSVWQIKSNRWLLG